MEGRAHSTSLTGQMGVNARPTPIADRAPTELESRIARLQNLVLAARRCAEIAASLNQTMSPEPPSPEKAGEPQGASNLSRLDALDLELSFLAGWIGATEARLERLQGLI